MVCYKHCYHKILVGTSGGAWVAINAALERPALVSSAEQAAVAVRKFLAGDQKIKV